MNQNQGNLVIADTQYQYDPADMIMSKTFTQDQSFGPGYTEGFTYDYAGRLTSATSDLYAQKDFTYYANNNFNKKENKYFAYGTRPHAVTEIKENDQFGETLYTYAYDSNGNMTQATGHSSIKIRAKKTAGADNPRMELWINGDQYMAWLVTNTDYHDFTWNGIWKTTDAIELRFVNGDEISTDLYVDKITLNNTGIESEDVSTEYVVGSQTYAGRELMDVESLLRFHPNGISLLNRTITYNYDNRVTGISENGNSSSFAYDYKGGRIYKSENGVNTYYFGAKYEEQYQAGQPTKHISYYFANGQRIAQRTVTDTTNELLYYHTDHLGSAVRLTDTSGNPVQSIAYAPFGETVFYSGIKDPKYQYTGQELDAPSGLYYYGARYYAPEIGRFIQADTILDGLNRYAYCWNNPMNYVDPSGHEFQNAPPAVTIGSDGTISVGGSGATIHTSGENGGTQNGGGGGSMNGADSHKDHVDENGDLIRWVPVDDERIQYGYEHDMGWVNYGDAAAYLANNPGYSLPGSVGNINVAEVAAGRTPPIDGGDLAGRGGGPNIDDLDLEKLVADAANEEGAVCTDVNNAVKEKLKERGYNTDWMDDNLDKMMYKADLAVVDGILEDLGIGEPDDQSGGSKRAQDWANKDKPTFGISWRHVVTILKDKNRPISLIESRGPKCGGGNTDDPSDHISDVWTHFNWSLTEEFVAQHPEYDIKWKSFPHYYGFK